MDLGSTSLEETLRKVLRNKYQETCPNCARKFSLADLSQAFVGMRTRYRVTCESCGTIFVEIYGTAADSSDGASDIIAALYRHKK